MKPIIHLCIPQLFQPLNDWKRDFDVDIKAPELALLLRDVCFTETGQQGLEASLFSAVFNEGFDELPMAQFRFKTHPNKDVVDADIADKTLLCADPTHFEVGMNDIILTDIISDLSDTEAQEVVDHLNAHFEQDGLQFIAGSVQHWYMVLPKQETISTHPLSAVYRQNIAAYQPTSVVSGQNHGSTRNWQALQTEVQMVLHTCELNQQREMAGLPTVNSLWFWGAGAKPQGNNQSERITNILLDTSANIEAQTIAQVAHCPWGILDSDLSIDALIDGQGTEKHLIIQNQLHEPAILGSIEAYQKALEQIDCALIKPLRQAWQAGKIELLIDACNGKLLKPLRIPKWKFWKKKPIVLREYCEKKSY